MKKILYSCFFISTFLLVSCKKNITDLNINPTRPAVVSSANLFSNASVNLSDRMASTNVNTNNFRLFVQYWTETIYRDETRYNLNQRSISDFWWAHMYRDVIKDLTEASTVADKETLNLTAEEIKNRKAINEILIVYSYYTLVTSFGDIPYTEALDIENLQPAYDNAAEVFAKISARLDAALSALDPAAGAYGSADVILNGDIDGWKRFGNSLKMRMGMLVADVDPTTAKTMVEASAPNVILSNNENIKMHYLASPPNTNPVWEDLIQSGRHDFVGAKPFIDTLKAYNDPRLPFYFNKDITTDSFYIGQTPGVRATFNNFSAPSSTLSQPEFPHTFFSYSEMEFLKAEALERGFAVGSTAEDHYNNAIDASIEEWGGTAADALAYRSQSIVKYTTAAGDYKEKIGVQSWIALYNRGYDAWTQWRRLDYPKLVVPTGALFSDQETPAVITRMTYPVVEQNLNKGSYQKASSAVGKDQITQKLWFDKY
ncbi:SusD/RagB family nutrient-binding outer membrane lipoprotein [Segetibacter koreensis]|uniref:SusD/RagB family nutrient-binding outer membrane lipoprotein n=1 Tax=Segetibacter koreensis TaxID=398037 RepID=UPI0003649D5A|nr:SusD/RagB family nutrient-binding outer membrane lipoprotein [Segetibacter koreensis]